MNIVEATNKFNDAVEDVMGVAIREALGDPSDIKLMSEENFKALQAMLRLTEAATKMNSVVAQTIIEVDRKIDELNKAVSKQESKVH